MSSRTLIMGILNMTPDSFSGDGLRKNTEEAIRQARVFVEAGCDILDVGGESTRPGSEPVSEDKEKERVIPLITKLSREFPVMVSVDTYKASVAEKAIKAGAKMVNDISGMTFDARMPEVVAKAKVPVVLTHIRGTPKNMQENPYYENVVKEVTEELKECIKKAEKAGILKDRIWIDPGIGFGKRVEDNLKLLQNLHKLKSLGKPILIGTSRKSFIGKILNLPVEERLFGTAATVALAISHGADAVRVHDVKEMVQVARMTDAIVRRANSHVAT